MSLLLAEFGDVVPAPDPEELRPQEAHLLGLTNEVRARRGRPAVWPDTRLQAFARWRAQDLLSRGVQEHGDAATQLIPFGLAVPGFDNLCKINGVDTGALRSCFDALVASPAHAANLLDPAHTRIGIGVAQGGGYSQLVQVFARLPE